MLAIKFTFAANRYHATPWGRHVNEGVSEWPPSPWRILRGIVATWRRTLAADVPADRVEPVLRALASECPKFHLPPASTGHTRHYMPEHKTDSDRENRKTTLVIDSFVAIQRDAPLFAVWPSLDLNSQQRNDLERILHNMPYLGRAESWVSAELASEHPDPNSYALELGAFPEGDWEVVRTLVPHRQVGLRDLEVETSQLRSAGRIDPEGARWCQYIRKRDCFTAFRTVQPQQADRGARVTVVRFAMSGKVLPMASDTLRWGEIARKAAMSRYGHQNDGAKSPILSGKDVSGKPLEGHRHTLYLSTDEDGDGRLDHLTVWATGGMDSEELRALLAIRELNRGGGRSPLRLVYQVHGSEEDFQGVSRLFGESKTWRSLTPYVLPRHVKYRGPRDAEGRKRVVDSPEEQIMREVAIRWPDRRVKAEIKDPRRPIAPMQPGRSDGFRPFDFFRYRDRGSNGGGTFNFELEFREPVLGPIALGFACHYGLGLFVPSEA